MLYKKMIKVENNFVVDSNTDVNIKDDIGNYIEIGQTNERQWRLNILNNYNNYLYKYENNVLSQLDTTDADNLVIQRNEDDRKDMVKSADIYLKAFSKVMLDEINILRNTAGLPERTLQYLINSVSNKL